MEKNEQHSLENEESDWEPSPEDFIFTEEEIAEKEEKQKKKNKYFRMIGIMIAVLLILQAGHSLFQFLSHDSRELARTSEQLSQHEHIATLKDAVVTIQGQGSKGTGFSIHPSGYILTNHHVINHPPPLAITFPNGDLFHAEVVEANEELDIALLKVDGEQLPYLSMRFDPAAEGEPIYVIGNPLTQTQIVNEGEIMNNDRDYQVMKLSASIFPGHSGSPVFSEDGEVVGVVYARTVPSLRSDEESYGLAVPMGRIVAEFPILDQLNQLKEMTN